MVDDLQRLDYSESITAHVRRVDVSISVQERLEDIAVVPLAGQVDAADDNIYAATVEMARRKTTRRNRKKLATEVEPKAGLVLEIHEACAKDVEVMNA